MIEIYNDSIRQTYDSAKRKYKIIKKIIDSNKSINQKQKEIDEYLNNFELNTRLKTNLDLKLVTELQYDEIYKTFNENMQKYPGKFKKTKELHEKISNVKNRDIIVITLILLSDLVRRNNTVESVIRYSKTFEYLTNNFTREYFFLIKNNKDINTNNVDDYVTVMLKTLEDVNLIEIILEQTGTKTYKYIAFNQEFIISLNEAIIKKNSIPRLVSQVIKKNLIFEPKNRIIRFNKERSHKSMATDKVINNLNYLRGIEFEVDKKVLNEYINNLDHYCELFADFKYTKYKNVEEYLSEGHEDTFKARRFYDKEILPKSMVLVDGIVLAEIFKNETIYFNNFIDFRGRIYYEGWGLQPQTNKILRKLLKFKGYSTVCRLDAHASGFQVFGAIFRNIKLLELTNVLKHERKNDLYTNFAVKLNISQKRELVKNLLMCLAYNESTYTRAKKILADEKQIIGEKMKEVEGKDTKKYEELRQKKRNLRFDEPLEKSKKIEKLAYEMVPELLKLKGILKKVFETSTSTIKLVDNEYFKTYQFYTKNVKKKTSFKSLAMNKRITITLSYEKKPIQLDKNRSNLSTIPNLTHNIDSLILNKTVNILKNKNIPIYTTHDCFTVPQVFENDLQKAYKVSIYEVFNEDILKNFITINEIKTEESKEIISELDSKKNLLSLDMMSDNILDYE